MMVKSTHLEDVNSMTPFFNFSTISEGKDYSSTMLATDGFNTANVESGTFCISSNLSICDLKLLNVNQTTALFEFIVTNNLNNIQENINWTFDTGDANITSTINFNLTGGEDIFIYVEYIYGSAGNYQVVATTSNANFTDLPNALIHDTQQVYIRTSSSTQQLGTFDKFTLNATQRWCINYIISGESFANMENLSTHFYSFEMNSLQITDIIQCIQDFINGTA